MAYNPPKTREEFKFYCMRRLGWPVIELNMDDTQIEDAIDDALNYYWEFHADGTEVVLIKHKVTQEDIDNRSIEVPYDLASVSTVYPYNFGGNLSNFTSYEYQFTTDMIQNMASTGTGIINYVNSKSYMNLLQDMFNTTPPFRFNQRTNKLYIDFDWKNKVAVDGYLFIQGYQYIDIENYDEIWEDRWFQRYATMQIKRRWGEILKKLQGIQLPGGISFNGDKIYEEAVDEIDRLESEMIQSYSKPLGFTVQ